MFLASRKARRWRWIGAAAGLALAGSYAWAAAGGEVTGGTAAGITYGIVAAALLLVLVLFGWRKRAHRSKAGTLEGWLQGHVVLGLLVVFVALAHTGGRFEDSVAVAALVVMGLVAASGVVGAYVYQNYPRQLTEVQSNLSKEEISERLNRAAASMARLAAGRSRAFEEVYRTVTADAVPGRWAGWRLLAGKLPSSGVSGGVGGRPGADAETSTAGLGRMLAGVPPEEQEALRQLLVLGRQHKELHLRLAYQERYRNLLDVWLWVHVPLTVLLVVLVVVHVVAALYFGVG